MADFVSKYQEYDVTQEMVQQKWRWEENVEGGKIIRILMYCITARPDYFCKKIQGSIISLQDITWENATSF